MTSGGRWALAFLALIVAATAAARWVAIDIPLERDEGEYAYAGQLLLQGVPPYTGAYNMKFPGIYFAYALGMALFGESIRGVHLTLLLANIAAILLVYILGTWLSDRLGGLVSAASYALLSMQPSVLGLAAHATHFIVVPALAGAWLLVRARDRGLGTLFTAGVLLGIAVLMKQHGALFAFFGLGDALWSSRVRRALPWGATFARVGAVGIGIILPLAAMGLYLLGTGAFERFWFWTVQYAGVYAGEQSLRDGWAYFAGNFFPIVGSALLLWLLAASGLIAVWTDRDRRDRALWITALGLCSFLATVPGLWFRQHYFIVLLPAVAMLAGTALAFARHLLLQHDVPPAWSLAVCVAALGLALTASVERMRNFLDQSPNEMSRAVYGTNPFPEAVEIARHISAHSKPEARIAVLGSEPEIYFYARRRSATGYIYTYALMETVRASGDPTGPPTWIPQPYARRMQHEMIRGMEAARPEYIVFVEVEASWLARRGSELGILEWLRPYLGSRYERVGVADILPERTEYRWGAGAASYPARSTAVVHVFRRREPAGATAPF